MKTSELEKLIKLLSKLPGLGPRSARRAVLALLQEKDQLMVPLMSSFQTVLATIKTCEECGNQDVTNPCGICADYGRDHGVICIVETVADLWALERTNSFKGVYHVLGGVLSPLEGIRPEDLTIEALEKRIEIKKPDELIFALSATVNGQTTVHYIADLFEDRAIKTSKLAHGVPVGGELDYLDEGTLSTALKARLKVA